MTVLLGRRADRTKERCPPYVGVSTAIPGSAAAGRHRWRCVDEESNSSHATDANERSVGPQGSGHWNCRFRASYHYFRSFRRFLHNDQLLLAGHCATVAAVAVSSVIANSPHPRER